MLPSAARPTPLTVSDLRGHAETARPGQESDERRRTAHRPTPISTASDSMQNTSARTSNGLMAPMIEK
ncbi:hypothetical protein KRMM14A1004_00410 [Krasilnikovia sp. MM14-A1004]